MFSTSTSSCSSKLSSSSQVNLTLPPSPSSLSAGSALSSKHNSDQEDAENVTVTRSLAKKVGKPRSQEDLRLLAVSTHMTELSYAISDIQTRIFEIQELRHKSQSSADSTTTTNVIDQSLINLNEKLESVEKGMKSASEALEPLLQTASTPTFQRDGDPNENTMILRKHATLQAEWEAIQNESDVLREELKEDKWLTVFRTVTDQADGMMSSLEKAVNRCQDFIWQVHRHGGDDPRQSSTSLSAGQRNDKPQALTLEVCNSLLESFEAKKKHYMPATSKVLSIIDKGVRDRVTKNGETLRRHAESAQRWKNLRERISRTDIEMDNVRRLLSGESTPSEAGSSTSGTMSTRNGYLATPPSGSRSRAPSSTSTLSRSISPFRKFARKLTGTKGPPPVTPLTVSKNGKHTPSSEPIQVTRRQKNSLFPSLRGSQPPTPITPERPGHKYSQSLTPDSSPRSNRVEKLLVTTRTPSSTSNKQRWNMSTKVEPEERTTMAKGTPPKRPPSAAGTNVNYGDVPPVPALGASYRRSLSRASMASSRPWSPVTSSVSTTQSSQPTHYPVFRPPSRAQTPSGPARGTTPGPPITPRSRPKTPSHIPIPLKGLQTTPNKSDTSGDEDSPQLQRALSPAMSTTSSGFAHPPRPPSRSMIPVPSLHLSTPSRPSSSMSDYSPFRSAATRAQTPEHTLRARVQQMPFFHGTSGRSAGRASSSKLPPSSFKDSPASRVPSRPGSRTGAYTPTMDNNLPMHEYIPGNTKDPLDIEVAGIVNSIPHGLLVERVDAPLKKIPKEGEEIKAQYAFSNSLSRKVVTCRLTTLSRPGKTSGEATTKKVMCRVGGGWQDLSHYILNRQAGM